MTSDALTLCKIPHTIVIEPQEIDNYRRTTKDNPLVTLLELDMSYKEKYDVCDNLGLTKSTGPGPARNFIWDHSISLGYDWHWIMDDNIRCFYRLHNNVRHLIHTGSGFAAMEDFCLRYTNLYMAGPNYRMFVPGKQKRPPFVMNTRIYSCNLIRNDIPYRWRGRYNEDTDLSLRILKDGFCTVQFNAFLQDKIATQQIKGGNTGEFYAKEGTSPKSNMQYALHPDCTKLVIRFGREHHYVDYTRFKKNRLIRRANYRPPKENPYKMKLVDIVKESMPCQTK